MENEEVKAKGEGLEAKVKTRVVPFDLERAMKITLDQSTAAVLCESVPKYPRIRTIKGDAVRIICWNKKGLSKMKIVALLDCTLDDVTEPVECTAFYNDKGENSEGIALLNLCIEEEIEK